MAAINPLRGPPDATPAAQTPAAVRTAPVRGADAIAQSRVAQPSIDAVSEIEALAAGTAATPANNIAEALYELIRPKPSSIALLQSGRLIGLLGLAADVLADAPVSHTDFQSLGAAALIDELRHHQAVAERRAEQDTP